MRPADAAALRGGRTHRRRHPPAVELLRVLERRIRFIFDDNGRPSLAMTYRPYRTSRAGSTSFFALLSFRITGAALSSCAVKPERTRSRRFAVSLMPLSSAAASSRSANSLKSRCGPGPRFSATRLSRPGKARPLRACTTSEIAPSQPAKDRPAIAEGAEPGSSSNQTSRAGRASNTQYPRTP